MDKTHRSIALNNIVIIQFFIGIFTKEPKLSEFYTVLAP